MLKPERMSKLRIYVPSSTLEKAIKKLHDLKVMHFIDHKKTEELDIGSSVGSIERISASLVKARALLSLYKEKSAPEKCSFSIDEIEKKLSAIDSSIKEESSKIRDFNAKISERKEILSKLAVLNSLYLDLESYQGYKALAVFVGYIKHSEEIKQKLASITSNYKLHVSRNGISRVVALFVENSKKEKVAELLKQYSFSEVDLTVFAGWKGSPISHINILNAEVKKLSIEKEKCEKRHSRILDDNKQFLADIENYLEIEAEKAEAPLRFAHTKRAYIITGWVPKDNAMHIKQELENELADKIYIAELSAEKGDKIPVKLDNPKIVKPFEFLLRLFSLPGYNEIDPTTLMFFTFPIFFGFMLGDVGYGIITLLLFLYLKKKVPSLKQLLNIMCFAAVMSIFFGVVFGEYLGFEAVGESTGHFLKNTLHLPLHVVEDHGEMLYEFPRLINRMHGKVDVLGNNLHLVLVIGGIVGLLHINLSLLLGFINEFKSHGFKHAFMAKFGWVFLEIGLALVVITALEYFIAPIYYAGAVVSIMAIIMIYLGEGIQGIIELPSLFSNTLSYLRLGAVGLASVGLAIVINEKLAMPFFEKGGIFVLVAVLIMVLGHAINIALGLIGPFLHSIRLHYVEFFLRFYHGGGIPYSPFGAAEAEKE